MAKKTATFYLKSGQQVIIPYSVTDTDFLQEVSGMCDILLGSSTSTFWDFERGVFLSNVVAVRLDSPIPRERSEEFGDLTG